MNCTNLIQIPTKLSSNQNMNLNLLNQIMDLPDKLRKEIRLMAKQYKLLELYREDNIYCDSIPNKRITLELPYVLKYKHYGEIEIFEWHIPIEMLRD